MLNGTNSELRVDLMAADYTRAYEVFSNFSLGPAPEFILHINPGTGTAGTSNKQCIVHFLVSLLMMFPRAVQPLFKQLHFDSVYN